MSDPCLWSQQRATKRKAEEVLDIKQGLVRENAAASSKHRIGESLCEECTDPKFIAMIELGQSNKICKDLERLLRNRACPCCRLLRGILLQRVQSEWISHAQNRAGLQCTIQLGKRDSEDQLQRNDVSSGLDVMELYLSKGSRRACLPLAGRKASGRCAARLEATSCSGLHSSHKGSKFVMVRRSIELDLNYKKRESWINECRGAHPTSAISQQHDLIRLICQGRFRLIDVTSRQIICKKAVESYCALSYVWSESMANSSGRNPGETTCTIPRLTYKLSGEWDEVPKSIQNAIDVVRKIGERYLWVDYLCIDQCDSEDKAANIAAMSSTYKSADLTIVVVDGANAESGLSRTTRSQPSETPVRLPSNNHEKSIGLLMARPSLEEIIERSVWNTRAWTFQEHMLSRKCLIFTPDEVIFDCSHRIYREAYELLHNPSFRKEVDVSHVTVRTHSGKRKTLHQKALLKAPSAEDYARLLYAYTSRKLTYPGDRLDAFSGILSKFHGSESDPGRGYAESGIPIDFMYLGLVWAISGHGYPFAPSISDMISTDSLESRIFPTWSWIAWSGCVASHSLASMLESPKEKNRLRFVFKNKYNIVAQPFSEGSEWPWLPHDDLSLCKPEPGGPVTIHIAGKMVEVELKPIVVGPPLRNVMILVSAHIFHAEESILRVFVHPKHIWDHGHNSGFALLRFPIRRIATDRSVAMLLQKIGSTNVYNRVSPDIGSPDVVGDEVFAAHSQNRYIKLR